MRKALAAVLVLLLLAGINPTAWAEELRLAVTSDLHFSLSGDGGIYPLLGHSEALVNTLIDQLLELHPDALLLCGDNTNSGRLTDMQALTASLRRLTEAGIPVIAVPGNHDFDLSTAESYAACYAGLFAPEDTDPASLGAMVHLGSLRILAMDDSSYRAGTNGEFSADTLHWLVTQLREAAAAGERVLFLSHHNVLPGGQAAADSRYRIQNVQLRDLLESYGVTLCLSGHRHSQEVLSDGTLYEIISAMPAAAPCQFGWITVDDEVLHYATRRIDFARYGARYGLAEAGGTAGFRPKSYRGIVERVESWQELDEASQQRILALFSLFMEHLACGSLNEIREQILSDPVTDTMLEVFSHTNYGAWMAALLRQEALPGNALELSLRACVDPAIAS